MGFFDIFENRMKRQKDDMPFDTCNFCGKPLGGNDFYVIAKAFDKGNLAMEAVQCMLCQESSSGYISEQSTENIQLYAGRRFKGFLEDHLESNGEQEGTAKCLFTGEELEPYDSFELYSIHLPHQTETPFFLVGSMAVEQMAELLSEETRKFWDSYMQQIQPVSPDWVISPLFLG